MYFYKYIEDGALESQLFPKENCPENVVEITEEEYIAELEKMDAEAAPPSEPEPEPSHTTEDRLAALESENKTLKAQVSAQSEQMDFYEECIAEMASVVYA